MVPAAPDSAEGDTQPGHAYRRAQDTIRRLAEGEDYSPGDKIPSERTLSEQLGLSRMTVRKAIDQLVAQGVLERRSTSGTHVAAPKVLRPLDPQKVLGIPQIIENSGGKPSSRLLFFEAGVASDSMAGHLDVRVGAPLIVIRMLQMSDGIPFCVEKSYFPAARVPGLVAADLIEGQSLYVLLRERYGITVNRSRGVLTAAPIGAQDAGLLSLEAGATALIYRVSVYDADDRPIEHAISINHPQRTLFTTDNQFVVVRGPDGGPAPHRPL
ncbi:MAG: GntR family transcriptional regulator [Devosia sp.]